MYASESEEEDFWEEHGPAIDRAMREDFRKEKEENEEKREELDGPSMYSALATKEKAKTIGMSAANALMKMRYDESDNKEEIKRLESRYMSFRDKFITELGDIEDGILYGLAAQYIIAMLITAGEQDEAQRIFSTVTHELPRKVITEKHGAQLGSSQ